MIQFEDKKGDIYQILSFCLGHLKRKILLLLKFFLNEQIPGQSAELIKQIAKEQSSSDQYIALLHNPKSIFTKDDEILYQRFVSRIKELIRNYLPHASLSHQFFVYLKKIETYSFKPNYQFQDYILHILADSPPTLAKIINEEIKQIKKAQSIKRNSSRRYDKLNPDDPFGRLSPYRDPKKYLFMLSENLKPQMETLDYQSNRQTQVDNNNRPIDVFNRSLKPILDCLDCDISTIRGVYFNLQKQRQSVNFSKRFSDTFTITKGVTLIQEEMLFQNRFIKESIKFFDKQYAKYTIRLEKYPDFYKRQRKRCQTANGTKKNQNFSLLTDEFCENTNRCKSRAQARRKFQTINNYPSEQEKQQLYKELQKRKNTVLKMKSISISANKGHLELCSENKINSKKLSLTFNNMKKMMNINNSRNMAVNLKKKYEIFMNNISQNYKQQTKQQQIDKTLTISPTNRTSVVYNTITHIQKSAWLQSPINLSKKKPIDAEGETDLSPHFIKQKETISHDQFESRAKNTILRRQIHTRLSEEKNKLSQTSGKFNKINQDFDNTIKNVMKGGNVNHRNYANTHQTERKLLETINPQLTVKTIRKT